MIYELNWISRPSFFEAQNQQYIYTKSVVPRNPEPQGRNPIPSKHASGYACPKPES